MTNDVRDSYDAMAEKYAELFLRDIAKNRNALEWLAKFTELAAGQEGIVADLGCGPGHVSDHLTRQALTVKGYDLSPGQIEQARLAFPALDFAVGDLGDIDHEDASLGGIVARYSIIHVHPAHHADVFAEWTRVLQPGAPVLVSFFGSLTAEAHGTPFDHTVVTAYELFPATIAQQMEAAGFTDIEIGTHPTPEGGRPFDQGTILARKPSG